MKTVSQDTKYPQFTHKSFTDSIAEEGKEGDSYYNMMKYNLDKIAEGLSKYPLKTSFSPNWRFFYTFRSNHWKNLIILGKMKEKRME